MKSRFLLAFLLLPVAMEAQADTQWVLDQSTLSYHMSHPMHQVDGVSHAAKGKGTCHAGQCSFLIAAPVKSFDSGDTNRDLHMLESTRGAQFPMVVVRTSFPEAATAVARPSMRTSRSSSRARPRIIPTSYSSARPKAIACASQVPFPRRVLISRLTGPRF